MTVVAKKKAALKDRKNHTRIPKKIEEKVVKHVISDKIVKHILPNKIVKHIIPEKIVKPVVTEKIVKPLITEKVVKPVIHKEVPIHKEDIEEDFEPVQPAEVFQLIFYQDFNQITP